MNSQWAQISVTKLGNSKTTLVISILRFLSRAHNGLITRIVKGSKNFRQ